MSTIKQHRFSQGEVAPTFHGAADLATYLSSLAAARNGFIGKSGGFYSRPGTSHVATSIAVLGECRLIPWVFNADQAYLLEFTNLKIRIIRNGALVTQTAQNISGITNANPAVVTYSGADTYANGDTVLISGVVGMEELNNRVFTVANVDTAANTFELSGINSSSYGTYSSAGTVAEVVTVTSPYSGSELADLQFAQDSDTMFLTHKSYAPRQLTRSSHTSWTLAAITFGTSVSTPTGLAAAAGGAPAINTDYAVTAIDPATGEESLADTATRAANSPSAANPITLTWTAVGATPYNLYRTVFGGTGLIGAGIVGGGFADNGVAADYTIQPPSLALIDLTAADKRPQCVAFCQQRTVFANSNNDPDGVWALQIGRPKNYYVRIPPQDDDAMQFRVSSRQVNEVRHIVDIGRLLVMTAGGEYEAQGNDAGIITPTSINLRQVSAYGSSKLSPILVNGSPVFVQARGNVVRDLGREIQGFTYRGNDLTALASHLFEGYTLVDWAYQQVPNSVIWAVRSDGIVLSFTYLPEYQVWAWARHDLFASYDVFDRARVMNVCAVPEGDEDAVYFLAIRNGGAHIERLNTRYVQKTELVTVDVDAGTLAWFGRRDFVGCDNALTYDGRNTTLANTMTLSGGTNWTADETLTLTSSASYFSALDVGNEIHLSYVGAIASVAVPIDYEIQDTVRLEITGFTSATVVSVRPHKTVPATMRSSALSTWARAVDDVTGLWHLNGESVSVLGDGYVLASPDNSEYAALTVSSGRLALSDCYAVIHVGERFISDMETLDIDTAQGSLSARKKVVTRVTLDCEKTLGVFVGPRNPDDDALNTDESKTYGLTEAKFREFENPDDPTELRTGKVDVNIQTEWSQGGRIFVRRVDPVPMAILSIAPTLEVAPEG